MNEDAFIRDFVQTLTFGDDVVVPPGDDCAALAMDADRLLLVAVDQVAAGTHYYGPDASRPTPPELAGRKLLARNLSDIAAMAGTPTYALVALSFPKDVAAARVEAFAGGIRSLAEEYNVQIIGGDLGGTSSEFSSLTIIGVVNRDQICRRDTAQPGDRIVVTGEFGDSLITGKHLSFTPRLEEARWLSENGATSMIDVSDGLLKDLSRVCRASNVRAGVDEGAVPCVTGLEAALGDGEDYELIATIPAFGKAELKVSWPFGCKFTEIGRIEEGVPGVSGSDGLPLTCPGFEHF